MKTTAFPIPVNMSREDAAVIALYCFIGHAVTIEYEFIIVHGDIPLESKREWRLFCARGRHSVLS